MNKKSKLALKGIVKECLLEILAEGLVGSNNATLCDTRELRGTLQESYEKLPGRNISETKLNLPSQKTKKGQLRQSKRPSYLDSIKHGVDNTDISEEANYVKKQVATLTDDPIMSEIFADTALTTLKEQKEGSRPSGPSISANGDQVAKIVDQSSPEELFGESTSKWANLAFAPSIRK